MCNLCKKNFTRKDNYKRHKQYYCKKNNINNKKSYGSDKENILKQLIEEMKSLKNQNNKI